MMTGVEREFLHRHGEPALNRLQALALRQDAHFAGVGRPDLSGSEKRELNKLQDKWNQIERDLAPTGPQGA
jgi:hypothetical protein